MMVSSLDEMDKAHHHYLRAAATAIEIGHRVYEFNAIVSIVVTRWAREEKPDKDHIDKIRKNVGKTSDWLKATDSSLMIEMRRKVLDDPASDNNLCIFFDTEKCFECRVERNSLRKECIGNLFWMGNLCPYFREFLAKLYEDV